MKGFALQLKPVGSFCNLSCRYPCYVEQFKTGRLTVMPDVVWQRAIGACLTTNKEPTITWHGGEPTLAGLAFYQRVWEFIQEHRAPNQKVRQVMQTHAGRITPAFAAFFAAAGFEIGVSIDGPEEIHGVNRVDWGGRNSFRSTMRGLAILRDAGLDPSVIATVTVETLPYAAEVFDFLVAQGFTSIKYSPTFDAGVDAFSISSEQWYEYLSVVFDRWMNHGDADISVLDLDEVIAWLDPTGPHPMCSSSQTCVRWVSVDPDGSMYPCAYFRASMLYGNILTMSLQEVVGSSAYQQFRQVFVQPPEKCRQCEFFTMCGNGCPATRLTGLALDPKGVYVYCEERRRLFQKVQKAFAQETG
jgi:uncharacterized protein